jgi:tetratricopeptide (TPR) repeat protein
VLGPDHPQVSIALQLIATILYMRGDLVGSRAGFERVLAIREGALGPDHPELAITVNNLASVAYEDHRWEDALRYYRRVLAIREKVLGPEDARLVDPLTGIGGTLVELYRPAEAVPALERALVIATAASTPPADLADARFQLARALWRSGGDRRRAVELATEAGATTDNDTLRAQTAAWLSRPQ